MRNSLRREISFRVSGGWKKMGHMECWCATMLQQRWRLGADVGRVGYVVLVLVTT